MVTSRTRQKVEKVLILQSPLHFAADNNCKELTEILISDNADINAKNEDGWTSLHVASKKHHKEITEILISNKEKQRVSFHSMQTLLES